jgi:hypothetical protein
MGKNSMRTAVSTFTRSVTRDLTQPLNILSFATHERYQSNLAKTNHNFYLYRVLDQGIKDWDNKYASLPLNHILLSPAQSTQRLEFDKIPSWIDFDLVLSQNRFGQYQVARQIAQQWQLPLVNLEHTLPVPTWSSEMLGHLQKMTGHINLFISDYSRKAWGFSEEASEIIHHGIF